MAKRKGPEEKFDREKCRACGECLASCPYIPMDAEEGREQMRRLLDGRGSVVLERCAGCVTCSAHCPEGCDPYALIRSRWAERYKRSGLPERARFLMPHSFPNFRTAVPLPSFEREFVRNLAFPPDADTVLFTGCNTLVLPEMLRAKVLGGLPSFGSFKYCCGEMYYRMGLFDAARESGRRLRDVFRKLRAKKMVFLCAACMDMVAEILPGEFGIRFDFEKQFLADWLLERMARGELEFRNPLRRRVTVQDTCHAKLLGDAVHDSPRRLLEAMGAEIVEPEHTKRESLCCGIAAGCSRCGISDIASAGLRRLEEFRRTGAESAATVCNGCQLSLSMLRVFHPLSPRPVPLLQLAQLAAGEKPDIGISERLSRRMLLEILAKAGPALLSPQRFRMESVMKDVEV